MKDVELTERAKEILTATHNVRGYDVEFTDEFWLLGKVVWRQR